LLPETRRVAEDMHCPCSQNSKERRRCRPGAEPVVYAGGEKRAGKHEDDHSGDRREAIGGEREGTYCEGVHRTVPFAVLAASASEAAVISPTSRVPGISCLSRSKRIIVGGPTTASERMSAPVSASRVLT